MREGNFKSRESPRGGLFPAWVKLGLLFNQMESKFNEMTIESESRPDARPSHDLETDAIDEAQGTPGRG